jgi:hypothetical protein
MINIENTITINSNDYILAIKTLLEELIQFYRIVPVIATVPTPNLTTKSFDGAEPTDFAGLNYVFANYQELKLTKTTLETLLGFDIVIPSNFDLECNNKIQVDIILRSEVCSDIILKQNRIFDFIRYTLTDSNFYWSGGIATNINSTNTQNIDISNYRINNFSEINQQKWVQTQTKDNYVVSQQSYQFLIHKN